MPMPNSARKPNSIAYEVENPLSAANTENQRMDSISGSLRPQRSAAVPASAPPTRRITSVTVPRIPARKLSTVKVFWMSIRTKVMMVKSNPSSTQPRNVAQNARH